MTPDPVLINLNQEDTCAVLNVKSRIIVIARANAQNPNTSIGHVLTGTDGSILQGKELYGRFYIAYRTTTGRRLHLNVSPKTAREISKREGVIDKENAASKDLKTGPAAKHGLVVN